VPLVKFCPAHLDSTTSSARELAHYLHYPQSESWQMDIANINY